VTTDERLILLTNDDGVRAEGLVRLAEALDGLGAIHVVAPDRQRSAIGHAITLDTPLKVEEVALSAGLRALACSGTPTDCVMVAVHGLLPALPDLVVSGINHGANMGEDLTYSGTVSAAMEGALMGIPSMAVSAAPGAGGRVRYEAAAAAARAIARLVLDRGMAPGTLLNVNAPSCAVDEIQGASVTRLGYRDYAITIQESTSHTGERLCTIQGGPSDHPGQPGTDVEAIAAGRVSVTPVSLDLTASALMRDLVSWPLDQLLRPSHDGPRQE